MNKDSALALRERLRSSAEQTGSRLGFSALQDDGKLYHDEVGDLARWTQRLSLAGRWPHLPLGEGAPACPGLRFEVWFFQGKKDEEILLLLLCGGDHGLDDLQRHLAPTFKELLEGGRYAKRYRPLEPIVSKFYPGVVGLGRRVSLQPAKAEPALVQLLEDALKPVDGAIAAWDPNGEAAERFKTECSAYDPLAALKAKFGK
jgi:hypothetical protein